MSVQFGRWNFEGEPPAPGYINKVSTLLAPYGPDGTQAYSKGGIDLLYGAFHTTKESHRETQPLISPSGAVITWDGRLDNRQELIRDLVAFVTSASTDVDIVAAAYDSWGPRCFARLIGDWALSIWNPDTLSLFLAKDFIGTRHLYYSLDNNQITWSTILDPLVLFASKTFAISEEYIAGWLSQVPSAHLTPFARIKAVPASSYVLVRPPQHGVAPTVSKYWDFDPSKKIRYRTNVEYEEHFRAVFAEAVRRTLRSDRPVLAELSGGMDSSSIVCMADSSIARGKAETPRLDTISWFDDSVPEYDERSRFTKVEEKRGRAGWHIDLGSLTNDASEQVSLGCDLGGDRLEILPSLDWGPRKFSEEYAACMTSQGHRVTLSGFGGEQPTGGGAIPTPTLELLNLLARGRFLRLSHQLKAWAARMRQPRRSLLWKAVHEFLPVVFLTLPEELRPPGWFDSHFIRRNHAALCRYPSRTKLFGPLPSFQKHLSVLDCERRLIAHCALHSNLLREIRFPFLDRDFREFAYAIPWEQIVGVGQRRSLMRRALVDIVPDELLNRKHRTPISEDLRKGRSTEWLGLVEADQMVCRALRIIEPDRFKQALQKAQSDQEASINLLTRALTLESWLRQMVNRGVLTIPTFTRKPCPSMVKTASQPPVRTNSSAS